MSGPSAVLVVVLALAWVGTTAGAFAAGYALGRRRRPPRRVQVTLPRR